MNIVIAGAGDVGTHLAATFSKLNYTVILIDIDSAKLEMLSRDLDVITRCGSADDWKLLESLLEFHPDLFLAMSDNDELNLVSCTCAKKLGYPQTIARLKKNIFFNGHLNFEEMFSIDHLIGPEILAAEALANRILSQNVWATELLHYSHLSNLQLQTLKVPKTWKNSNPLKEREHLDLPPHISISLIFRPNLGQFLFPDSETIVQAEDILLCLGPKEEIQEFSHSLGIEKTFVRTVVIGGGSKVGVLLANLLEKENIKTWMLEKDVKKCYDLAQHLPRTTIINHDMSDYHYLRMEKIANADAFVACTNFDQTNVFAALAFKELECPKVMITLADQHFVPILQRLHIEHVFAPKLFPIQKILSLTRQKSVATSFTLFEHKIGVCEIKVSADFSRENVPLKFLQNQFPKNTVIGMIQRNGTCVLPQPDETLLTGDIIIMIALGSNFKEIEKLF